MTDHDDARAALRPRRTRALTAAMTLTSALTLPLAVTTAASAAPGVSTARSLSPSGLSSSRTSSGQQTTSGFSRSTTTAGSTLAASTPAASSPGDAGLTLSGDTPPTLTKDGTLSIKVAVRNTSDEPLKGRTLTMAVGRRALDTLVAQNRWAAGDQEIVNPVTVDAKLPDISPGQSSDVTVTLPASKLGVSYSMASLPMQLTINSAKPSTLRTYATWATTTSSSAFTPMSTSLVIPVTLPDDPALLTATGQARFAAWNKAIGPGSAIEKLLTSNPSTPVTWMIDPAVLDPAAAQDGSLPTPDAADNATTTQTPSSSSSASSSSAPPGSASSSPTSDASSTTSAPSSNSTSPTKANASASASPSASSSSSSATSSSSTTAEPTTPTTVEQLAANLIQTLKSRPSTQQIVFTPYGDPDLSTLTADDRPAGSDALLKRSLERQLSPTLAALSKTVVAAPTAPLSISALTRLDAAWSAARGAKPLVFTPNVTLDGSDDVSVSSAARRSTGGVPLVGYTSALSQALSADGATDDVDAGLHAQAASLALYQQLPSASRSLLVMGDRLTTTSPSRIAHVARALDSAPWNDVKALDVSDARGAGTVAKLSTTAPPTTGVWPQPMTTAFGSADVTKAAATLNSLTKLAGVVEDGDDIVPAWTRNLDQEASTRWRGNTAAVDTLVDHAQKTVDAIPEQVHVVPAHINFFSDSGSISVTVKNDLARDVNGLRMSLTPRNYAVQFRSQPAPMNVKANGQTSFRVPVAAQAAGLVSVDARLTSANGVELGNDENQRGEASPLQINARPTGTWIFWVLGIVALLVFCYGLVRARQKGTRRRDELARDIQL